MPETQGPIPYHYSLAAALISPIGLGVTIAFAPAVVTSALVWTYSSVAGSFVLGGVAGAILEKCLPVSCSTRWTKWLGVYGLVVARNETMVANIENSFEEDPDYKAMVVVTGRGHQIGMARLLTTEEGYEEIAF